MRNKNSKTKKTVASKKTRQDTKSHEFETMSQIQNRYGNGRERNGTDGTSAPARGSNH
jgi:hypothetical protein